MLGLIATGMAAAAPLPPELLPTPDGLRVSEPDRDYEPHAPIFIPNDAGLCHPTLGGALSGVRNCGEADGSAERPYVISGWHVEGRHPSTSAALTLRSTNAHVVIRDNIVEPLPHEIFVGAPVPPAGRSLLLQGTHDVVLENNLVYGPYPLWLQDTARTTARSNTFVRVLPIVESGIEVSQLNADTKLLDNVVTSLQPTPSFAPGISVFSRSFTIDGNRVLNGHNPAYYVGGFALLDYSAAMSGFGANNWADDCRVVVLRGLQNATYDAREGECVLALLDSEHVVVRGVRDTKMTFSVGGSRDVVLQDLHIDSYDQEGGAPVSGALINGALTIGRSRGVLVQDCFVDHGRNEGVGVFRSFDVTFEDCHVDGEALRLFECQDSPWVTFRDGSFGRVSADGVLVGNCYGFVLEDSEFSIDDTGGQVSVYDSSRVRITNNRIEGRSPDGTPREAVFLIRSADAEVARNTVKNLPGPALRLLASSGALVDGNRFERLGNISIWVDGGTSARIEENDLSDSGVGIRVGRASTFYARPQATIAHNLIQGNDVGLSVGDAADPVDARYNWWGAADGPGGIGPGAGDSIHSGGVPVLFDPWLTSPPG